MQSHWTDGQKEPFTLASEALYPQSRQPQENPGSITFQGPCLGEPHWGLPQNKHSS